MKKLYKIIIGLLLTTIAVCITLSITYSRQVDKMLIDVKVSLFNSQKTPKYHFFIILHNSDEPYVKDLEKGLIDMASSLDIAIETNYSNGVDDYKDTIKYINIAIDSKVDGIITHAYNTEEFQKLIDKAEEYSIPVITLDADLSSSKGSAYVGTNGFEIGSKAGKLVAEALKGKAKVAIILESSEGNGNLKLDGFNDGIKNYKDIKVETVEISDNGILGANNVTQEIINSHPSVNAIVCTSSKDAIGAAQLVVDFNRVGDITIIGYDSTPEILSYIQKGVIYGTIVPGAYKIGGDSIRTLVDLKDNGRVSAYTHSDSIIITKSNLNQYLK
ncbi:ABC transporter substrate binding protein [Clostridium sp.]|uniref:ABC transporter substrate binding protein n=1 Tax=Clostridium sp. TaxID=1506 RepID=UPI001A3C92B2|nr:ABC transporter substrate binding protein [Clostridium sp.]MBK5236869.1 substrate-binding domain-containing protein [Clostridium sp.]